MDPVTGRASGPEKQKFHNYLGVIAREKIPIVHSNWKNVPKTLKDMVWGDILVSHINSLMHSNIEFIFLCIVHIILHY